MTKAVAKRIVVAIKVDFELNTPDGLRRVIFGLEKDSKEGDVVWKIHFQLFERDDPKDDFGDALVTLNVEVDTALQPQAETAAQDGLTPPQAAHAVGPAADDAADAAAGNIGTDEAKTTVQATLAQ